MPERRYRGLRVPVDVYSASIGVDGHWLITGDLNQWLFTFRVSPEDLASFRHVLENGGDSGSQANSTAGFRFKGDLYGIRGIVSVQDVPLRFEIVRESRIELEGQADRVLGVPPLALTDRITEKLLANADRRQDRSTAYRDAIDLGMLALHRGPFPDAALKKTETAYGEDVMHKLHWVLERLTDEAERRQASIALGMDPLLLNAAVQALSGEFQPEPGMIAQLAWPLRTESIISTSRQFKRRHPPAQRPWSEGHARTHRPD